MSAHVSFLPAQIRDLIQEKQLTRMIAEPLMPSNLWRQGIPREKWDASTGESKFITRNGLIDPVVVASTPGVDPSPSDVPLEQWFVTAENLHGQVNVDIRQNFHTVVNEFVRRMNALGRNAGQSVGRWSRKALFNAYCGGHTWNTAQAANAQAFIRVQSIAGFTHTTDSTGRLVAVSAANPIAATIGSEAVSIIAAVPLSDAKPHGAGTLTCLANIAAGPHAANTAVLATNRPYIYRVGGASTVRGIGSGDVLTIASLERGVARLRKLGVPTFSDKRYRVYLSPEHVRQLRRDTEYQLQVRGVPDHERQTEFEVGYISGCTFVEIGESPSYETVAAAEDFAPAVTAAQTGGQNIARAIIVGADTIVEHYVPEGEFSEVPGTSGAFGMKANLGDWTDMGNYVSTSIEGIRVVMRQPLDAKGERSTVTWSWTGDFGIPTDSTSALKDGRLYKRAVVIETADLG